MSLKSTPNKQSADIFTYLPYYIWRKIIAFIDQRTSSGFNEHDVYITNRIYTRQRQLLNLASVNSYFRHAFLGSAFYEFLLDLRADGTPVEPWVKGHEGLKYIRRLYIRINTRGKVNSSAELDSSVIVSKLCELLANVGSNLVSITIEARGQPKRSSLDYSQKQLTYSSMLNFPRLKTIHILGHNILAAAEVSQEILKAIGKDNSQDLWQLSLNDIHAVQAPHTIVVPWVVRLRGPSGSSIQNVTANINTLQFSSIGLLNESTMLIKQCRLTLRRLVFLHCDYDMFCDLFREDDINMDSVVYKNLTTIQGALSKDAHREADHVLPSGVLPALSYLDEVTDYPWQFGMRIVPHLLFNTLMTSVMPSLHTVLQRASHSMNLNIENLPALRHISYRPHSEFPDLLEPNKLIEQLGRLLQHPGLQTLRFYDRIPPAYIYTKLNVLCSGLSLMDFGLITFSLPSIAYLLQSLPHLRSTFFCINDCENIDYQKILDNYALSDTLELLGLYIMGSTRSRKFLSASEEIITRLPNLLELQVHEGVTRARNVLQDMKAKQRYAWSETVADRVNIKRVDMYSRIQAA